jgi:hypothetical protein
MKVPRVSWAAVGHVQTPGRYIFKFGWVTVSEDDLTVWRKYPEATFALYESLTLGGEFRLGSFDPEPEHAEELRGVVVSDRAEPELSSEHGHVERADEPASSSSEDAIRTESGDAEGARSAEGDEMRDL